MGEIDKESYELTSEYLNTEINRIEAELQSVQPIISNQEEMIEISLKKPQTSIEYRILAI